MGISHLQIAVSAYEFSRVWTVGTRQRQLRCGSSILFLVWSIIKAEHDSGNYRIFLYIIRLDYNSTSWLWSKKRGINFILSIIRYSHVILFWKSCAISKCQYPTDISLKYLIPQDIKEKTTNHMFRYCMLIPKSVSKVTFGLFLGEMIVFAVKDKRSCLRWV